MFFSGKKKIIFSPLSKSLNTEGELKLSEKKFCCYSSKKNCTKQDNFF